MSRISSCNALVIIDGYNLLFAKGIDGVDNPTGTLEDARDALIDWILETLPVATVNRTILTFDAKTPPPNRPRQFTHSGLTVHFAADFEEADDLIGAYIQAHTSPMQLTVVSSDHRVQRMARRRDANAVDSDDWFRKMTRNAYAQSRSDRTDTSKPDGPLHPYDVQRWISVFGLESEADLLFSDEELGDLPPIPKPKPEQLVEPKPAKSKSPKTVKKDAKLEVDDKKSEAKPVDDWDNIFEELMQESNEIVKEFEDQKRPSTSKDTDQSDLHNPFPPGYGEDLLE